MRIKRKLLTFSIATLMIMSSLFVVSSSYAYWQGDVIGSSDTATATVATGEWNQPFQWDPNRTYDIGDKVIGDDGTEYIATKQDPNREPGVDKGWQGRWDVAN